MRNLLIVAAALCSFAVAAPTASASHTRGATLTSTSKHTPKKHKHTTRHHRSSHSKSARKAK